MPNPTFTVGCSRGGFNVLKRCLSGSAHVAVRRQSHMFKKKRLTNVF